MRKLILLFSLIAVTPSIHAQDKAVHVQDKAILDLPIPRYKILKADSTYTTQVALDRSKPVMFIYFAPDCPHCQHLMGEMKENMEPFKDIQIVMICATRTVYPYLKMLKTFSRDYDLPKYKNITMGSEYPTIDVVNYFHVSTTPFIAIYDHKGKMQQYFDKPTKVADIITALKKV